MIDQLRAALEQSPDNVPLRIALAQQLLAVRRLPEAEAEFLQGLALDGANPDLKAGLAQTFYAQGHFSKAVVLGEELINAERARPETYLLVAQCHDKLDDPRQAARFYRRALDLSPGLADPDLAHLLPKEEQGGTDDDADKPSYSYVDGDPDEEFAAYVERPRGGFADVGGMDEVKRQVSLKIIEPLRNPEIYAAYGKKIGGGILLYGPPGCGKTHLARATAAEVDSTFINVGISDVLDMFTGQSERNLSALFDQARSNRPSVLFFDEVDALAANRRDLRRSGASQAINQFLSELDGVERNNDGVLILAATNAPWHLDGAFRRPGRFDRIIFVPPPDAAARVEILRVLLRDMPASDVDVAQVARKTKEFSGADLKAVVDQAVEAKLERALDTGVPEPLATKDLLKAAKAVRPSTKEWFAAARNHALYANESGLYDDILEHMGLKK